MTATDRALELVRAAAQAASDKLAENILAFDVSEQLVITDAFLLCSAPNDRQVKAIVDEIEDRLRELGAKPVRREGERDGRWVLIDYADIVVHVQHEEERAFYALERLWRDCPLIPLPDDASPPAVAADRPALPPARSLLRHGRTAWNDSGRAQGHADVALDDTGHAQAAEGAVPRGLAPAALWSSRPGPGPGDRAYLEKATGLAAKVDDRLREYDVGERQG